jgi:DNA-binding MarR family transcriptional regulator
MLSDEMTPVATTHNQAVLPKEGIFRLIVTDIFYLASAFGKRGTRMASKLGLTRPQWGLLIVAAADRRTVPQLARRMGLARQSVQRTADLLVKRRFASYIKNPDHLRSPLLVATESGRDILDRLEHIAQETRVEFMKNHQVANNDLVVTQRVLQSIREYINPHGRDFEG